LGLILLLAAVALLGVIFIPRHDQALTSVLFCLFLLLLIGDTFQWTI
tara:strand:- start:375 stop:515 length:141 start_codon:yes stop_codon:yes gene_type:complete